jgi:hypothetical protein
MSDAVDVQTVVAETYNGLIEHGYDPLAIAACLMVTAFAVYAKQLTPEAYVETMEKIFSTTGRFIEHNNRTLH